MLYLKLYYIDEQILSINYSGFRSNISGPAGRAAPLQTDFVNVCEETLHHLFVRRKFSH